jgi:two-component system, NarL family, sensor kinase
MRMDQFEASTASSSGSPRAVVLVPIAIVAVLAGGSVVVGLRIANPHGEPLGQNWWLVVLFVVAMAYTATGAWLVVQPRRTWLGAEFLLVGATATVWAIAVQYEGYLAATDGDGWGALARADDWARPLGGAVLVALVPWQLVVEPRRSRWLCRIAHGAGVAATAVAVIEPGVGVWFVGSVGLAAIAALGGQWADGAASGDPLPGWLFAGVSAAWLAVVLYAIDIHQWHVPGRDVVSALLLLATVPLLVAGALIEVIRSEPTRLQRISDPVVEWSLLTIGIVTVYTGLVAGLGRWVGGSGPTWLLVAATGAIALLLEPARRRIRRFVDLLVYGSRDDPLTVVQHVVDHVGADSGDDLLPALVVSLERELRLAAVAIDLAAPDGWRRAASVGRPTEHSRELPLHHRDELVGRLVIGWDGGPSLRARDEHVLTQLAGPLGLAVSWVRLAAELRQSSVAIVSAREEERRRLRRDLHDGLGPALAGISLGLRTAVRQLARSPDAELTAPARDLLSQLANEVDTVVGELRRIVRDLRPTALDQVGLVDAIAAFSRRFTADLELHLALPAEPVELPVAVEVAAYRIVTEALTNVVRHAHAARCWLTIETGPTVEIDVVDDGIGFDGHRSDGVGLTAMRERANELGGSVRVLANSPRGTHLHVQLPAVLP